MGFKNVVKSAIYVTDLKNFKRINDTYGTFFTEAPPARETVEVKSLPKGAHIEISVIAVK
jgi:2-iminobutanoate/2-iminopropanoate deaminase